MCLLVPDPPSAVPLAGVCCLLLGYDNGVTVPIDAAYHQLITNEFRLRWGYGLGRIENKEYLEQIIREVYDKYPLPPFE